MISLQVGQCGNQVALELYSTLMQEITQHEGTTYSNNAKEYFFREIPKYEHPVARSILVDMEPKVIQQVISTSKKSGTWSFNEKNQFSKQSGSANNWAFGYNNMAIQSKDDVENLLRKEVEAVDCLQGFFVMLSIAGGTGSGVGTYLTELLRDQYENAFIGVQPVWPFTTGDVIVQNYNSLLSLNHLYQVADALITVENDQLHLICTKLLNIKKVSFADMNKVLAQNLAGIFLPYGNGSISNPSQIINPNTVKWFSEPVTHLCSHPSFKFLNFKSVPQMPKKSIEYSSYVWNGITKRLYQMLITNSKIDEGIDWNLKIDEPRISESRLERTLKRKFNKSLSNLLILRGNELNKAECDLFANQNIYSNLSVNPLQLCVSDKSFNMHEKSATLLSNSQSIVTPLDKIVSTAYEMFESKAFLYQYHKHGISEDDFRESFVQIESVIQNYKEM